jgi:hypothetical protein
MGKLIPLKRKRRRVSASPVLPTKGGGGTPPTDEEIRKVLNAVMSTLRTTQTALEVIENRIDEAHDRIDTLNRYVLTLIQALLRAGVEVPLTSRKDGEEI